MKLKPLSLAALSAFAITGAASAATLLTPGLVQVEYTLGDVIIPGDPPTTDLTGATNFQTDASGNSRTMAAVGDAAWTGGAYAPGSTGSIMMTGNYQYNMNNATGIAPDFQVSIFLSTNSGWNSANTAGSYVYAIGDLRLEALGKAGEVTTYTASVGASQIGTLDVAGWAGTGLLVQKSGSTFSFWSSNDTGATWTQQGSDLSAPTADVNWAGTHLFVKPGGGSTYTGYADDFKVVAVPEPSAALLGGLGMLALLRRRR